MLLSKPARPFPLWQRVALFTIGCYAAALLSQQISFPFGSLPTIWLPSGVLVAVLLRSNTSHWLAYLLATLPVSLAFGAQSGMTPAASLLLFTAGALEAAAGAWVIHRYDKRTHKFVKPSNILFFVIVSVILSTAVSASLIAAVQAVFLHGFAFWPAWQIAWISRALGILIAAPVLLTWRIRSLRDLITISLGRAIEMAVLLSSVFAFSLYAFIGSFGGQHPGYIVVPFLVWAALRFGLAGAAITGLVISAIALWGLVDNLQFFALQNVTIAPAMRQIGSFLGVILATSHLLAAQWEKSKQAEFDLRESEEKYRLLIKNQGEGIGILDLQYEFTFANPAAEKLFGVQPNQLTRRKLKEFTTPVQYQTFLRNLAQRTDSSKTTSELEIRQPNGKYCSLLITATPQYDASNHFTGTFALLYDNTARKQVEIALRDSRSRYQTLFDHSPIAIWEEDFSRLKRLLTSWQDDGIENIREYLQQHPEKVKACAHLVRVLDVNQVVLQLYDQYNKAEFMANVHKLIFQGPNDVFIEEIVAVAEGKTTFEMEGPNEIRDGIVRHHHVRWTVAPGYEMDYRRLIVTVNDVTDRKLVEERMRYMSTHDLLTGLYNRNFFEAELERWQDSRLEPINVMVVDINSMKSTNDTLGHAAGDDLLRRAAQVLKLSFRKEDVIARVGGDEFVVLFHGAVPVQEAIDRVKNCLRDHNHWHEGQPLSLAIGAASGGKGSSLVSLYKKADQMMYKEKQRPRKAKPENPVDEGVGAGNSPSARTNSL